MSDIAIVMVGYNRLESIKRLFHSLCKAEYGNEKVDLIISLDKNENTRITEWADSAVWKYGQKKVYKHHERLGLRNHILKCGNFLDEYNALIVLEDDLFVAPSFFHFARSAVDFYKNDKRIAGISLYKHTINVNCNMRFEPENSYFDTFFIQFAQSWGQVWLRDQWKEFVSWYSIHQNDTWSEREKIPKFVLEWPENSWLKYHIIYCILNNRYFVYPYISQTTCFSDVGEHSGHTTSLYQTNMPREFNRNFTFMKLDENAICYDAFFERQGLGKYLGIQDNQLCVDFYSTKDKGKADYILSLESLPFKIEKSYALDFFPYELNVFYDNKGADIFLYNMKEKAKRKELHNIISKRWRYLYKTDLDYGLLWDILIEKIRNWYERCCKCELREQSKEENLTK